MSNTNYVIPENPIYDAAIRALQNTDPAQADTILNPLISQMINNTHANKIALDTKVNKADIVALPGEAKEHIENKAVHTSLEEKRLWNTISILSEDRGYLNTKIVDVKNVNNLVVNGKYIISNSTVNVPDASIQNTFFIDVFAMNSSYIFQTAYCMYSNIGNTGKSYIRYCSNGTWTIWQQYATAEPPQEIALPLSAGYTKMTSHKCCYSKSQDGTVLVHIAINHTSGTLPKGYNKIGQLPVGLYPTEIVGITYPDGGVFANPDGSINTAFTTDYTSLIETLTFRV